MRKILPFVLLCAAVLFVTSMPSPQPIVAQSNTEVVMVAMPDGTRLATQITLPAGDGPFPTLLMRTPYGRDGESDDEMASLGVAVVIQDARGTSESEGVYTGFRDARADGQATINWILEQAWSNGRIATYGGSALGIAQYMLAPGANEALVCQWVEVGMPNLHKTIYENGVYRAGLIDTWMTETGAPAMIPELRANPTPSAWWDAVRINDYSTVKARAFHVGGYYDIFSRGTIDAFLGYQNESAAAGQQHLVMGPWTHGLYSAEVGQLIVEAAEVTFTDELFLWLDACLFDGANGLGTFEDLDALPSVSYFTLGSSENGAPGNQWHTADTWPPPGYNNTELYLQPNSTLAFTPPAANVDGTTFQYNPADPSPTVCGRLLFGNAGACDQTAVEQRGDVIVFTTATLDAPLEVTGDWRANIWISTDVTDTDIVVRVTDVYPDGTSLLVLDSAMRATYHNSPDFSEPTPLLPGEPVLLSFDLGPMSYIFNEGHQIRVSITSANAPHFAPNPNTGALFLEAGQSGQIATTTVLHDADHPSSITLPIR